MECSNQSLRQTVFDYPTVLSSPWPMRDGTPVTIRAIAPKDEPMLVEFHRSLSEQTVYARYFTYLKLTTRISHDRLARICFMDPCTEMVLVAIVQPNGEKSEIIAVGRLNRMPQTRQAEIAILVNDKHQKNGLGSEIMNRLLHVGQRAGLEQVIAEVLPDNVVMQKINRRLDFPVRTEFTDGIVRAVFNLQERRGDHRIGSLDREATCQ